MSSLFSDRRINVFNRLIQVGYITHFVNHYVSYDPFWLNAVDEASGGPAFGVGFRVAVAAALVCAVRIVVRGPSALWITASAIAVTAESVFVDEPVRNHTTMVLAALWL